MSRNGLYKMSSLKCTNLAKARAQRIEEQNGNRRTARQAKNDANRGLVEINSNVLNISEKNSTITTEISYQQKLQERLARLKIWRQEKIACDEKARATRKAPFLVPGISKINKAIVEVTPSTNTKLSHTRVTRSQAQKAVEPVKYWTITKNNTQPGKKQMKNVKKENEQPMTKHSFAPKGFVFTAPKEISAKALEIQDVLKETDACPKSGTPHRKMSSDAENDDIKISPLVVNHPWISTTRGSSSRKQRMSLETLPNQEVLSSPVLKKRSMSQRKSVVELSNADALKFRALMASEGTRLTDLCNSYEELLANDDIPEEETGSVRTVIGQAHLLQRERFVQFAGLVNQFESKTGEKEITSTDLEGFWEMIYLQVSDVDKKFDELDKLKENGWIRTDDVPEQNKKRKVGIKKKAPAIIARPAKSNMRALIAAARKKQLAEKSCSSPSMKRRSSLLMSPARTPGKRQSLRRSVLLHSAKKPVFTVTEIAPSDIEHTVEESDVIFKQATPDREKTCSQETEHVVGFTSPEQCLPVELDTLKNNPESCDQVTPLKVFRSHCETKPTNVQSKVLQMDNLVHFVEETFVPSPRRSTRIRSVNNGSRVIPMGRASLLPTPYFSPVIPNEDLISFD